MRRGDIISVSLPRDYEPRPALVIQSDDFAHLHSVTVAPLTSEIVDAAEQSRITVEPAPGTGLRVRSQVMIDKVSSLPRAKAGPVIGRVSEADMGQVTRTLAFFFGLA